MKCTTCAHPQRQAIDQALLAGDATFEALSRQYGPSISALYRHKKHLEAKTRRARARLRDNLSLGFFCKLNNFLAQIQNAAQTADAEGNAAVVLKTATVGTRIINSLTKQELPLELDMVYRFLASPQWATQDSLLPTDPQILTDSHQAIAAGLFFPCPELTLPDLDDEDDYDDENDDDAGNKTAHEAEAKKQAELSRLLSRLDLDPTLATPPRQTRPSRQPATGRRKHCEARNYREIRALPKILTNNIKKITPAKKLARKTPVSGGTRRAAPAKAKRLPPIIWKATPRLPPFSRPPRNLLGQPKTGNRQLLLRNSKLAARPLTHSCRPFPF